MSANSFGSRFVVTTFGESHGPALGVIIDGCPAGVKVDPAILSREMSRRRPGVHQAPGNTASGESSLQVVSARQESDQVEILSGVFEGLTLGTPIAMMVRNQDARSGDYEAIKNSARAGHADDLWQTKFGHRDHRGGGRSSGRETVSRVMAGAIARMVLQQLHPETEVIGYASQIGPFELTSDERVQVRGQAIDRFQARFPSSRQNEVADLLKQAQMSGESYGGVAEILLHHPPANLGQPVFRKLKSDLAQAFLSVGAANGFELGLGFESANEKGTEFHQAAAQTVSSPSRVPTTGLDLPSPASENYGGIRGGISTGENILLRVSFKPTSSILDVAKKGRHDPCIVTRAIPVLEAMTWLVLADQVLWSRTDRI